MSRILRRVRVGRVSRLRVFRHFCRTNCLIHNFLIFRFAGTGDVVLVPKKEPDCAGSGGGTGGQYQAFGKKNE